MKARPLGFGLAAGVTVASGVAAEPPAISKPVAASTAPASSFGGTPLASPRFASVETWKQRWSTPEPKALQRALFGLAQEVGYVPLKEREAVLAALLKAPLPAGGAAQTWVEGVFRAAGPEAEGWLRSHASSKQGTAESRGLAGTRATELQHEREARTALTAPGFKPAPATGLFALPKAPEGADARQLTLTPKQVQEQITAMHPEAARAALLRAGIAPSFATDCDGTTWMHDIGDALFARGAKERLFLPAAAPALKAMAERYGLKASGDANDDAALLMHAFESGELIKKGAELGLDKATVTRQYYESNVFCFAGHSVAEMKQWGRELFDNAGGFEGKIYDGVRELMNSARDSGLIPYAASASNQWLVEIGAEYLGIPPWRCAGIKTHVKDGLITADIEGPVTFGPGKVEALKKLTGGRPAVAAGDSVDATDREMLESALVRLAVEPKSERQAFVVARGADNWRFVDYQRTLDGEEANQLEWK